MVRRSILIFVLVLAAVSGACTSPSTGGAATNAPAPVPGSAAPASAAPTKGGY